MANVDGASEKSWWGSFTDGLSELAGTWFNYDLAKTNASSSSSTTPVETTTSPSSSNGQTLLIVGGLVVAVLIVFLARGK